MGAIGIVLQTKVFVNLKQTLLLRDGFRELRPARIAPEEPGRSRLEPAVGQTRRQFFVGRPDIRALGEKVGQKNVRENIGDA